MQIALGLAIALLIVTMTLLALLRAGIRRQERATSLASEPRGLSAAVARRVLGLYASQPTEIGNLEAASRPDRLIADGEEARRS
jgi:hypothetical protein